MIDNIRNITTSITGISNPDMILIQGLRAAIKDLKQKPHLLRYCFAGLVSDPLTKAEYGKSLADKAIRWFLDTEIPVFLDVRNGELRMPCISVKLASSVEAEATLGDVNTPTAETCDIEWPNLAGPFVAQYDYTTGVLTLTDDAAEQVVLYPNQIVLDGQGNSYKIEQVLDFTHVVIAKNLHDRDFTKTTIRGQYPAYVATLESVYYKETYQLGLNVAAEADHLIFLYSVIIFILHMYKQSLFEARNLERTTVSASDLADDNRFGNEIVYRRTITLSGFSKQYWPKKIVPKINALVPVTKIAGGGLMFDEIGGNEQLWVGNLDAGTIGKLLPDVPAGVIDLVGSGPSYALAYWGTAPQPGAYSQTFITSLQNSKDLPNRSNIVSFNAGMDAYYWYAYPAAYGGGASNFIDNNTGSEFGMQLVATVPVKTADGVLQSYLLFRSDFPDLGVITARVT